MTSATSDETSVPKISGKAPNCSATGSQVLVVTKLETELADGQPRAEPQLEDQEAEQHRNRQRAEREEPAEDPVAVAASAPATAAREAPADGGFGRDGGSHGGDVIRRSRGDGHGIVTDRSRSSARRTVHVNGEGVRNCLSPSLVQVTLRFHAPVASAPTRSPAPAAARSAGRPPSAGPRARASSSMKDRDLRSPLALSRGSGWISSQVNDEIGYASAPCGVGDRHPEVGIRRQRRRRGGRGHALERRLDELARRVLHLGIGQLVGDRRRSARRSRWRRRTA